MSTYDFIIVGSGPAGASLASKLANTKTKPSVLLLEAGGDALENSPIAQRFLTMHMAPQHDWGYTTEPQQHLGGRRLPYPRGNGLGGSTNINYCMWTTPSKPHFNEWAKLVGDDFFGWENARKHLDQVENYTTDGVGSQLEYIAPRHQNGDVPQKFSSTLTVGDASLLNALATNSDPKQKKNLDVNSGDPIGFGIIPATSTDGEHRATAYDVYLKNVPSNLEIRKQSQVAGLILEGTKAVGVKTVAGDEYFAKNDVILSCGALDTPKLLLLSGIGPKSHLEEVGVDCVADLPGVGANLTDHTLAILSWETSDMQTDTDARNIVISWQRDAEVVNSKAAESLSPPQKRLLTQDVPTGEVCLQFNFPPGMPQEKHSLSVVSLNMMNQSTGFVRLASASPTENARFDPKLLDHPFDRLSVMRRTKTIAEFVQRSYGNNIKGPINAPVCLDDKDVEDWVRDNTSSGFHPACSVKMGTDDDPLACVDSAFRVRGFSSLRVVDLSVCPLLPDGHTTSVAYLIGSWAAEKISKEYNL